MTENRSRVSLVLLHHWYTRTVRCGMMNCAYRGILIPIDWQDLRSVKMERILKKSLHPLGVGNNISHSDCTIRVAISSSSYLSLCPVSTFNNPSLKTKPRFSHHHDLASSRATPGGLGTSPSPSPSNPLRFFFLFFRPEAQQLTVPTIEHSNHSTRFKYANAAAVRILARPSGK